MPSYPPTGAVPPPRRSTASARAGRPATGSRGSGRHPAVEPRAGGTRSRASGGYRAVDEHTSRSRASGGHRAVGRARPDDDRSRRSGGYRAVDRRRPEDDRSHPTGGHRAVDEPRPADTVRARGSGGYRAVGRARPENDRSRATGGHPAAGRTRSVDDRSHPSGPLPAVEPSGTSARLRARPGHDGGPGALARVGLHLALAAVPLLAISAQVFGLFEMRMALAWMIVPAVIVVAGLALFAPHPVDRILTAGLVWGVVGCVLYDLFRLDTVYVLGWWGDFIPSMGSWVSGGDPGGWDGAVVGYLWRYLGDGGGIGITFFVFAAAVGLNRWSRRNVVLAAVAFAVFPVWAGLVGTVALAPRGEEMLFPLTPVTLALSLIGHLIFGVVLGLGFWRSRNVVSGWPWPAPAAARRMAVRHATAGPPTDPGQPARRRSRPSSSQVRPVANSASRSWS